jgi:histidyl-tRNA synthetase
MTGNAAFHTFAVSLQGSAGLGIVAVAQQEAFRMSELIDPRVLKGFRDFLPSSEIARKQIEAILESSLRSFGFVPIDTPALEYSEILLGKGGGETDKQVYRFRDNGDRDVALRFDLTVPFARFMAAHGRELPLPFKRYHIAKVWRGENTQRGRYREFKQCDFDIVGIDSANADLEIILLIEHCFAALGIADITIEVSQRQVFNRFLQTVGGSESSTEILRLVDKLPKIGRDRVAEALAEYVSDDSAGKILNYIETADTFEETLRKTEEAAGGPGEDTARLALIHRQLTDLGISCVRFNPSITRGLDYYTGIVYETFLRRVPGIGSVCSGGRYNNLASLYTKQELPGVGASIGLDRLIAALEELHVLDSAPRYPEMLVAMLEDELNSHYQGLARYFRSKGFSVEVALEAKKLGQQFQFADRKGIRIAIICGRDEYESKTVNLRVLETRENYNGLSPEAAAEKARELLETGNSS